MTEDATLHDRRTKGGELGFRRRLRTRLVAVMALSGAVLLISGAIGLRYVDAIGETLRHSADLTQPLLSDVLDLTQTGRRARASVRAAAEQCKGVEAARLELDAFDANAAHAALDLAARAAAVGASRNLDRILEAENRFVEVARDIFGFCLRTDMIGDRILDQGEAASLDVTDAIAVLDAILPRFAVQAEAARASPGPADAARSPEDAVANLTAIRRDLRGFSNAADIALSLATPKAIEAYAARRIEKLRDLVADLTRLEPAFRALGLDEARDRLLHLVGDLDERIVSDRGLLVLQRGLLGTRADLATRRIELGTIDDDYFRAVGRLEATARRLDAEARAEVAERTREAYAVVATTSLVLLLFALALAGDMARRITGPIEQFTDHVHRLRGLEDLDRPLPPALARRSDEIGTLADAFAHLTGELAAARRRLEQETEARVRRQYDRLQTAIATMPQGFFLIDAEERLVVWNQSFLRMYGFCDEEVAAGMRIDDVLKRRLAIGAVPATPKLPLFRTAIAEGRSLQRIEDYVDGRIMVITASPTADGGAAITHEDITDRRRVEAEVEKLARFDVTTGLANRSHFRERIGQALRDRDDRLQVALLYVDLDHFKTVNDSLGHSVGDRLLAAVAERIHACCGEWESVGRLGGDEFAVLQTRLDQPIAATDLARRLNEAVAQPYEIDGNPIVVTASIGIAVAPDDSLDTDTLLCHADMALYRAKSEGRGVARFFEPEMNARLQSRRTLELDLREALTAGQFQLHYQPLVGAASGRTEGFEALLRWHHPALGLVPPNDFVPIAEEIGLIGEIGAWVLREATRAAATWPSHLRVSVNISPVQIRTRVLTLDVLAALGRSGLDPDRLELEITEGVLLGDTEATLATLAQLREFGVRFAMDDFGTGYSSLGYLRRFAFDKVKIDQSFVRDLGETSDAVAIVRAVTGLCSSLGIITTAEGVETEIQRDRLRQEGCDQFQGWLFGHPMPEAEVLAHLARESAATATRAIA
jgi:diguanylate cyclase (GGDEF)-like protein